MIQSVIEDWEQRQSHTDSEDNASTVRVFDVVFDGTDNPQDEILIANDETTGNWEGVSIPALWEEHSYDPWMHVVSKDVEPGNGPLNYTVTVRYEKIDDPLNQPPEIEWLFATSTEPLDKDIDGNPITNSADEPPDPPLTQEINDLVLRVVRNEESFDHNKADELTGAINSVEWLGWPAGAVKCNICSGIQQRSSDLTYWQVTYEFEFRYETAKNESGAMETIGWERRLLDQGFRVKTGVDSDGKPTYLTLKDSEENPLSQQVKLDGEGKQLDEGADSFWLQFDTYRKVEFPNIDIGGEQP